MRKRWKHPPRPDLWLKDTLAGIGCLIAIGAVWFLTICLWAIFT